VDIVVGGDAQGTLTEMRGKMSLRLVGCFLSGGSQISRVDQPRGVP
jgi:hypothetical protein